MEHGTCMSIKCKFCFVHLQVNHAKAPLSTVCADSAVQSRRHVLACTGLPVVVKPGVNRHFIRRSRAPSVFPACTVFRPDSQFDPFVTSQISFKCLHSTSLKLLAATSHLVEEIECFRATWADPDQDRDRYEGKDQTNKTSSYITRPFATLPTFGFIDQFACESQVTK